MLKVRKLSEQEFNGFAAAHPDRNFWQTPMMAAMQLSKNKTAEYLGVYNPENPDHLISASLFIFEPAHFGSLHTRSPRGPLMDYSGAELVSEITAAYKDSLKERNVLYWSIDPYSCYQRHDLDGRIISESSESDIVQNLKDAGFSHAGLTTGIDMNTEPRWIYIVPAAVESAEKLMTSFDRKAQRNILQAQKNGVKIRELGEEELFIIDELLEETGNRKGFEWRGSDYHHQLYRYFSENGSVRFLIASMNIGHYLASIRKELEQNEKELNQTMEKLEKISSKKMMNKKNALEDKIISLRKRINEAEPLLEENPEGETVLAGGIFFTYGKEVLCLMSGYREKYERFGGLYALHWEMMKYCIDHQLERYNLYGTSGDFSSDAIDAGVFAFKKGFGGYVEELPGDFTLPVQTAKYRLYKGLKNLKEKI